MMKRFAVTIEYEDERGFEQFVIEGKTFRQVKNLANRYFRDDKNVVAWDIVPIETPENSNA